MTFDAGLLSRGGEALRIPGSTGVVHSDRNPSIYIHQHWHRLDPVPRGIWLRLRTSPDMDCGFKLKLALGKLFFHSPPHCSRFSSRQYSGQSGFVRLEVELDTRHGSHPHR